MTKEQVLALTGLTDDERLYMTVWYQSQERFGRSTNIPTIKGLATAKSWIVEAMERSEKNKAAKERAKARKQQLKAYNKLSSDERDMLDTFVESALSEYKMTVKEICIAIENAGKEKFNQTIEAQIEALKKQLL